MEQPDFIVIGSGFGGSVAALRLAEKGYRVAVLERGRRVSPEQMRAAYHDPRALMWLPRLGARGFLWQRSFRHATFVGAYGVGGGSIVFGGVLLVPRPAAFRDAGWQVGGFDWLRELEPHYPEAARMLGRTTAPRLGPSDDCLREAARALGREDSFEPVPLGIYFGEPGKEAADPFFSGQGPPRSGCVECGGCFAGCAYGAKNSLDKNYLFFAEKRGVEILPSVNVTHVEAVGTGRDRRYVAHADDGRHFAAPRMVLSAGVIGTVELLLRSRDGAATLPGLSSHLGTIVRTNSETVPVVIAAREEELQPGPSITSHFYADDETQVTNGRLPPALSPQRFALTPMTDGTPSLGGALLAAARRPGQLLRVWRDGQLHRRCTAIAVMQHTDNHLDIVWHRGALRSRVSSRPPPRDIPIGTAAARAYAEACDGATMRSLYDAAGSALSAHPLGGARIADDPAHGVIDHRHEVFGYPGLFVVDGAAVPANLGVNPSLTITALAERAMSAMPPKPAAR